MRKRKEWCPNGYIFAALRRIWRWDPQRRKCLDSVKTGLQYICNGCARRFDRKGVAVDHKEPVVDPSKGFETWDGYITRLFVPMSCLQVLCKECHAAKTKAEGKIRRQRNKK